MQDEKFPTLEEIVKNHVLAAIDAAGGSKAKAAGLLGVSVKTVYNHVNRYNSENTTETLDSTRYNEPSYTEQMIGSNPNTESSEVEAAPSNNIFG